VTGEWFHLAIKGKRFIEVKKDKYYTRFLELRKLWSSQCSKAGRRPVIVLYNSRAFDNRDRWAVFEIETFQKITQTCVNVGPYQVECKVGKKVVTRSVCKHFKMNNYIVYRLGRLLLTNAAPNWKPSLPSPTSLYWKLVGVTGRVNIFKASDRYDPTAYKTYVAKITAIRRGKCDECVIVRESSISTY